MRTPSGNVRRAEEQGRLACGQCRVYSAELPRTAARKHTSGQARTHPREGHHAAHDDGGLSPLRRSAVPASAAATARRQGTQGAGGASARGAGCRGRGGRGRVGRRREVRGRVVRAGARLRRAAGAHGRARAPGLGPRPKRCARRPTPRPRAANAAARRARVAVRGVVIRVGVAVPPSEAPPVAETAPVARKDPAVALVAGPVAASVAVAGEGPDLLLARQHLLDVAQLGVVERRFRAPRVLPTRPARGRATRRRRRR